MSGLGTDGLVRALVIGGLVLVGLGLVLHLTGGLGIKLGRLPGDIIIRRGNFTLYFPIVTMLLVSLLLTLVLSLFRRP